MKKFLSQLAWVFDYYFAYFLYNPRKRDRYHRYMKHKYGKKYSTGTYSDLEQYRRGRSKY